MEGSWDQNDLVDEEAFELGHIVNEEYKVIKEV